MFGHLDPLKNDSAPVPSRIPLHPESQTQVSLKIWANHWDLPVQVIKYTTGVWASVAAATTFKHPRFGKGKDLLRSSFRVAMGFFGLHPTSALVLIQIGLGELDIAALGLLLKGSGLYPWGCTPRYGGVS